MMKKSIAMLYVYALLALTACSFAEGAKKRYILTLEIKQSHFTLNLMTHAKDKWNAVKLQIPVDKEFYDSVKQGEKISETFRTASFILNGSFGDMNVTVLKKEEK